MFLPLPEFGQEVPFPTTPHSAKGPSIHSSWKTNSHSRVWGQVDPQVYCQKWFII